jgi:hypothetical protein
MRMWWKSWVAIAGQQWAGVKLRPVAIMAGRTGGPNIGEPVERKGVVFRCASE